MVSPASTTSSRTTLQGLAWVLLRLMPLLGLVGLLIPLVGVGVGYALLASGWTQARWDVVEFWWMGATVVYWSLFVVSLAGCSIAWAFRRGKSWLFAKPPQDTP